MTQALPSATFSLGKLYFTDFLLFFAKNHVQVPNQKSPKHSRGPVSIPLMKISNLKNCFFFLPRCREYVNSRIEKMNLYQTYDVTFITFIQWFVFLKMFPIQNILYPSYRPQNRVFVKKKIIKIECVNLTALSIVFGF